MSVIIPDGAAIVKPPTGYSIMFFQSLPFHSRVGSVVDSRGGQRLRELDTLFDGAIHLSVPIHTGE